NIIVANVNPISKK
ncbi:hypothetical protein D046_6473B, partial [Vibrio parahaemolyticus V-223/04]